MLFNTLAIAAAASLVSASPVQPRAQPAALPLKQVVNVTSLKNLVARGQSKIRHINNEKDGNLLVSSGSVTNEAVTYVAPVTIGSATWDLIVDTGCK